jgi:hypothetical protein
MVALVSGEVLAETSATGEVPATEAADAAVGATQPASDQELANMVNNPTEPLTILQFRDIYGPTAARPYPRNLFEVQPVVPIGPYDWLPFVQLVKVTMPFIASTAGPGGETGLGDLTVFDLASIKQGWGRWGVGPILVLPTATGDTLGAGKFSVGPAAGFIYTGVENLTAGAILQNPISVTGSRSHPNVNQLIVSPTLTYNMPHGWFAGLSDFNWTFDWTADAGDVPLVPLGLQVGKVVRIGKQPVSISIEAGRAPWRPQSAPDPGWIIGFAITPIFNFHIGPHQKVRLRGDSD